MGRANESVPVPEGDYSLRETPGLCHSYVPLTPQGRPGEICVIGPKGQKVSCGYLWGGEWVLG